MPAAVHARIGSASRLISRSDAACCRSTRRTAAIQCNHTATVAAIGLEVMRGTTRSPDDRIARQSEDRCGTGASGRHDQSGRDGLAKVKSGQTTRRSVACVTEVREIGVCPGCSAAVRRRFPLAFRMRPAVSGGCRCGRSRSRLECLPLCARTRKHEKRAETQRKRTQRLPPANYGGVQEAGYVTQN